jgi:hypothetical protein
MAKFFASDPHCQYVTVDRSGRRYDADRSGFITVDDAGDAKRLTAGGYVQAGATPATPKKWVCDCGWEALINSCPHCDRTDLTRVVAS